MAAELVPVTVRFVTIMQNYSGKGRREVEMQLPSEPSRAVDLILERFQIPWQGDMERYVRIFVNGVGFDAYLASGHLLKAGDSIAFIPISGGG